MTVGHSKCMILYVRPYLWLGLLGLLSSGCQRPCGGEERACDIDLGRYFAFEPDDWDGKKALPVMIHFHGWNGSPESFYSDPEVISAASDAEVLLILPEGQRGTWSTMDEMGEMGVPGSGRDELVFFDAVVEDVEDRWPVATHKIYVTGHSLGASVVYMLACYRGDQIAAVAPSSGGFWDPVPESCPSSPIPFCHIHGLDDTTWPYEGREVTEGDAQGTQVPIDDSMQFWRDHNGCNASQEEFSDGVLTCKQWQDCEATVELCTHDGGHALFEGWTERELAWLMTY